MTCGLQEGYDALRHSRGGSFWWEEREAPLTPGPPSLSGGKYSASFNTQHHCSEKTTEQTQVGIAWLPLSPQENAFESRGFITALAKHQLTPAVHGTAQPPAQQRGIDRVSLPLQIFINSLLIYSINSWTSGKTELFNPEILKANILLFKSTPGICELWKVTVTAELKYPLLVKAKLVV